jgi:hypothetical protein
MSNLIPIKICELAIENLNKRIAELKPKTTDFVRRPPERLSLSLII